MTESEICKNCSDKDMCLVYDNNITQQERFYPDSWLENNFEILECSGIKTPWWV